MAISLKWLAMEFMMYVFTIKYAMFIEQLNYYGSSGVVVCALLCILMFQLQLRSVSFKCYGIKSFVLKGLKLPPLIFHQELLDGMEKRNAKEISSEKMSTRSAEIACLNFSDEIFCYLFHAKHKILPFSVPYFRHQTKN